MWISNSPNTSAGTSSSFIVRFIESSSIAYSFASVRTSVVSAATPKAMRCDAGGTSTSRTEGTSRTRRTDIETP